MTGTLASNLPANSAELRDTTGYIDTQGKMIINPQFQEALQFHDGLAAVRDATSGTWGYISR